MVRRLGVLAICVLAATPLSAQTLAEYDYENLTFRGLGLDVGYVWPDRVSPTPAYSLRVDLGYLGPGVRVIPSASYWSSRLRDRELERLADQINRLEALQDQGAVVQASDLGRIDWSDLSLSLDGQFVWAGPMNLLPYVGLGVSVHRMRGRGPLIEGTVFEDLLSSVTAGTSILAGFDVEPAGDWLRLYAEGRYTLVSNVSHPGLRFGAAFMVPRVGGWRGHRAAPRRAGKRREPVTRPTGSTGRGGPGGVQ